MQNNATGGFDTIAHAPIVTDSTGVTDPNGTTWYSFNASDVVLPAGGPYWSAGSGRFNVAHVKAMIQGFPLATFDLGADACMQAQPNGVSIYNNCASATSPVAEIDATCGGPIGDCCLGGAACDGSNICHSSLCQPPCGTLNLQCCQNAPLCTTSGTACISGSCQACGAQLQPCCSGTCKAGFVCRSGRCECGGVNEPCCPGKACNAGAVCGNGGLCDACGELQEPCCSNNRCNGLTCVPSSPPRCLCGEEGMACCAGAQCDPGLNCQGSTCVRPSQPPPQCVLPGGSCAGVTGPFCCANELCVFGTCRSCAQHGAACQPGVNELCCDFRDSCVLDQFTESPQCNIAG